MIPFLKHISSSNYMFIEVCAVLFLKINSHVKKMDRKTSSMFTLLHPPGSENPQLPVESMSRHKKQASSLSLYPQEGAPSSSPQTALNPSA